MMPGMDPSQFPGFPSGLPGSTGLPTAQTPGMIPMPMMPMMPGMVPGMGLPAVPEAAGKARPTGKAPPSEQVPKANPTPDVPKCHLHNKPQPYQCRFCKRWKEALKMIAKAKADAVEKYANENADVVEVTNTTTYNISTVLRDHILKCGYFKNTLLNMDDFNAVIDEIYDHAEHAEPYSVGSNTLPSSLFCALYKMFTMRLTEQQLRTLMEHQDSPYIRCCGFLYVRFGFSADKMWDWYQDYFCDEAIFMPGTDKDRTMTVGEYCETLLTEDKYFNTVLPRLPVKYKNRFGMMLGNMDEFRKRQRSNRHILETYRQPHLKVEVYRKNEWESASIVECIDEVPTRVMIRVRLDDGTEENFPLGYVVIGEDVEIISSDRDRSRSRSRSRGRRGRGRSPDASMDWCRNKGTTFKELEEKYFERQRQGAVATGKDYARPVAGFKKALQTKMDASIETHGRGYTGGLISSGRRRSRTPSPGRGRGGRGGARGADEPSRNYDQQLPSQQNRMAQLMERYGPQQGMGNYAAKAKPKNNDDVLGPDRMTLG